MKKLITIICTFLLVLSSSGQCPEIDGKDLFRIDQIFRIKDLPYGAATTEQRQMLDLYVPAPLEDCPDAKLIVIIHGGSFEGGNKNQIKGWGYHFAQKGFYVALINYRLYATAHAQVSNLMLSNFLFVGDKHCAKLNGINFNDGVYKIDKSWYFAVQDSRAAMSYIQRNLEDRGKTLSKVYVIGESAGGISALGMALGQQEDFNSFNPSLESKYGSIDSRITARPAEPKSIDAVVSISGGLINPKNFLSGNDSLPILFLHGGNDRVVPICEDECYGMERRLNGPLRIREIVDSNHLPMKLEMHFWAGEGHHLLDKYDEVSDIIMEHFREGRGPESIENGLYLYPSYALMYNCAIVSIKDEIWQNRRFVSDNFKKNGISVYPNPNEGTFTLDLPEMLGKYVNIQIYDAQGRQVFAESMTIRKTQIHIKAGKLSPGMYQVLIRQEGGLTEKIRIVVK